MIGIADPARAEIDLAASALACPGCTRPLHPWGHARTRTVRDHGYMVLALRPRRARCRTCRVTHVLLPAAVTLRRADTSAVIGSALLASAARDRVPADRRPARPAAVHRAALGPRG